MIKLMLKVGLEDARGYFFKGVIILQRRRREERERERERSVKIPLGIIFEYAIKSQMTWQG